MKGYVGEDNHFNLGVIGTTSRFIKQAADFSRDKKNLLSSIFPANFYFSQEKSRTPSLYEAFR
jgi:hypothetical protein